MPVIHTYIWKGFGEEKIKAAIQGITKVFVDLGVPEGGIRIIFHEVPKTHWGMAGKPASEM